jgi:hypothetical protein
VIAQARRCPIDGAVLAPVIERRADAFQQFEPLGPARRTIVISRTVDVRAEEGQCDDSLGIGGGEHHADRATFGEPEKRRTLAGPCIHHRTEIVGAAFEGRHTIDGIGQPRPEFVVENHTGKRRELSDERRPSRVAPEHVGVGEPARDNHQADRTVAHDLIGDVSRWALGVVRLRQPDHHVQHHIGRAA